MANWCEMPFVGSSNDKASAHEYRDQPPLGLQQKGPPLFTSAGRIGPSWRVRADATATAKGARGIPLPMVYYFMIVI